MKNYLLSFSAMVLAVVFSAFTTPRYTMISFHFIPNNGSEIAFEDASRWEVRASHPECSKTQNDVCILRIDYEKLSPYTGTDEQKLAAFLADQNAAGDYLNATDAVIACTFSKKP